MMKTTQKDIRATRAIDLTHAKWETLQEVAPHLEKIAYACGIYGINAALYRHRETGALYKVTTRSTAIFALD